LATGIDGRLTAGQALWGQVGGALFRRPASPGCARVAPAVTPPVARVPAPLRVGVIANGRSHRNLKHGMRLDHWPDVSYAAPDTFEALEETLRDYAARGVGLLVVNGGDGTLRDVMTAAARVFDALPAMAIIPSGKTNALALDLGIPEDWQVRDAIAAARAGRFVERAPVEILRGDEPRPAARGFLLGMGGFVRATELAQSTHRVGAFNGVAVGLALGWAIMQTLFGPRTGSWRVGTPMRLRLAGQEPATRHRYLLLASTLGRLPAGLKPFGPAKRGLKLLSVDAPPKRLWLGAPAVVAGSEAAWLETAGYHRLETTGFDLSLDKGFILDGELYSGGDLSVRQGPKLSFIVP